jgi:hypothetical protein
LDPILGGLMLDELTLDVIDSVKTEKPKTSGKSGTPTHELQRLGGWRSAVMVERYAHLAPDHMAVAANRIDSVLGGYDLATEEKKVSACSRHNAGNSGGQGRN